MSDAGFMQHLMRDDVWNARNRSIAATLGLGAFLANFDVTSVVVVMPAIGHDLGFQTGGLAWIIDAYSIAFTATLLVAGALADRFGRRRSLMLGNMLFLLASVGCCVAWNAPLFLTARALQGCGAAFLVTGALALVGSTFSGADTRSRAFGIVGVVSGVAMALGPSMGGIIGTGLGWRWIFLANLPICTLLAVVIPRLVLESRGDADRPLDWPSVVLATVALALIIDATLEVSHSPIRSLLGFSAGFALVTVFAIRQRRQLRPLLDPTIFASRAMLGVAGLLLAVSAGYWAVLVYLPLFLFAKFGWTTDVAGVGLLAATLPMLLIPPFGSRLAARLGWRRFFAAALVVIGIGGCVLATAAIIETSGPAIAGALAGMVLIGTGAALSHPQLSGAAMALAPPQAGGMASAVTVIARQAGFAIGVAALGALTPSDLHAEGFIWLFAFAAAASLCGALASLLIPTSSPTRLTV